jgi:hypothetical protein
MSERTEVVSLHASLRGLAVVFLSPLLLIVIGTASVVSVGQHPVPLVLAGLGVVLLLVAAVDVPHRVEFSPRGIRRVCLLRTASVPWEDVVAIQRGRPTAATTLRNLRPEPNEEARVSGGLLARGRGRRRWLLTDSVESQDEYDRLRELLATLSTPVAMRAPRPHRDAPPTDVYRPKRRR